MDVVVSAVEITPDDSITVEAVSVNEADTVQVLVPVAVSVPLPVPGAISVSVDETTLLSVVESSVTVHHSDEKVDAGKVVSTVVGVNA
jgi:hypothetical protein